MNSGADALDGKSPFGSTDFRLQLLDSERLSQRQAVDQFRAPSAAERDEVLPPAREKKRRAASAADVLRSVRSRALKPIQ